MADTKLTALDAITATAGTDIIYIVDDPGGSPLSKKIVVTDFMKTSVTDITFSGAFHPVIAPGSDTDAVLLEVTVTGTPQIIWDESEDGFSFNQHVLVTGGNVQIDNTQRFQAKNAGGTFQGVFYGNAADRCIFGDTDWVSLDLTSPLSAAEMRMQSGKTVFNAENNDVNFVIETVNDATAFHLDGALDSLGIGTGVPAGKLHVDQSVADAARPVLYLDQADVSEEFVKFVGTSADGVLTQSLVEEGDQASETLAGWLKIEIDDVGDQIADAAYHIPFYTLSA